MRKTMAFLLQASQSDQSDCIIWPYARSTPNGYGIIIIQGRRQYVHRLVCELKHGVPSEPMDAAHGPCHNRSCINPNHLSWKTRRDNILDRHRDGTMLFGETSPKSKYTDQEILDLRESYKHKSVSQAQFARDHGIPRRTLRQILSEETWKHLL